MRKIYFLTSMMMFTLFQINAQMGINKDGSVPHQSAMLDIKASSTTNAKGLLMPRVTDHTVITSPATGLMVFNTTTNTFWYFNGTAWTDMGNGGTNGAWLQNGTNVYTNNNSVGVNTATPQTTFDVKGDGFVVSQKTKLTTDDPNLFVQNMPLSNITYYDVAAGILYDPSGPNATYPSGNINTTTYLSMYNSNKIGIKLTFESFDTESSGDSIIIVDSGNKTLVRYSGNALPPDFIFNGVYLGIKFKTNGNSTVGQGFKIKWQAYDKDGVGSSINGVIGNAVYFETAKGSFRSGFMDQSTTPQNIGNYSVAMGYANIASGSNAVAMGSSNSASGATSIAMGTSAKATGISSTAIGVNARATGNYSIAFGSNNLSSGDNSVTLGSANNATGSGSFAFGNFSSATNQNAITLGQSNTASGIYSTAIGYATTASGYASTTFGGYNNAFNAYSTAMGYSTNARGNYSTSMGSGTNAYGEGAIATGNNTSAYGYYTTASGGFTTANNYYSTAMGLSSSALGYASVAMGYGTNATSNSSYGTSMGYYTTASSTASFASGLQTISGGYASTSMGNNSNASGYVSTALGNSTNASGYTATAMGNGTNATGYASTAMGYNTTASGNNSTALGSSVYSSQ